MSAGDLSKTMPNNADTQLALGLQLGVIKDSLGIEATSLADIEAAIGKPDVIPVLDVEKTLAEGQKLIDAGIPGSSMKLVCVPGGFVHDPSREKKISTTLMRLAQHPELIENPSNDFERAIVESYRRALETFPDMEPDGHRQTWSYEQTRPFEASFMKHLDELAPVTGKARPYGTASIFAGALLGMRAMFGSRYEYNPRPVRDHLTYDLTLEPGGDFRSINVYDSTQPLRKLMTQATWVLVFDNEGVDGKRVFPKRNMPDEYLQPMPLCVGAVLLKLTDPEAGTVIPCIESVQAPDDSAKPNPGENMPLSLRYGDQYGGSIKLCELSRSFKRRADHVGWVNLG